MPTPEQLVEQARSGDRVALDALVREIKDLVYRLAARMLGDPIEAEDATQEILIRCVTSLGSFRGESAFRTWVYRVASNHLLTVRGKRAKDPTHTFDELSEKLATGVASPVKPIDDSLMIEEAKLICTSMMLQALDRDHRVAFILGEVLELPNDEAAVALEISPDAYRKRLSRARTRMEEFSRANCGVVDPANACRCGKQVANAVAQGRVSADRLAWVHRAKRSPVAEIKGLLDAMELFRTELVAPESVAEHLRALIAGGEVAILS
ncbi:MAG: RNA polymerase sigma factor [Kofleriaceae bacterium]